MRFKLELSWNHIRSTRRERLEVHFEDFSFKPSFQILRYFKEVGWLGIWIVYEGQFLRFFGKPKR